MQGVEQQSQQQQQQQRQKLGPHDVHVELGRISKDSSKATASTTTRVSFFSLSGSSDAKKNCHFWTIWKWIEATRNIEKNDNRSVHRRMPRSEWRRIQGVHFGHLHYRGLMMFCRQDLWRSDLTKQWCIACSIKHYLLSNDFNKQM